MLKFAENEYTNHTNAKDIHYPLGSTPELHIP